MSSWIILVGGRCLRGTAGIGRAVGPLLLRPVALLWVLVWSGHWPLGDQAPVSWWYFMQSSMWWVERVFIWGSGWVWAMP